MSKPSKYNPQYHDDWGWSLAIKGSTDDEIADAFGISVRQLIRWKTKIVDGKEVLTSFGESLKTGKEIADAKVERKLYEKCVGFKIKEEQQTIEVGKDGTSKIGQIRTVEKEIPPDTMAIMYWLNNRKKKTGEWSQRQTVSLSNDNSTEDVVIYLPSVSNESDE